MKVFTNPIHQAIYDKVLVPTLAAKQDMVKAFVMNYDNDSNTADVLYYPRNSSQLSPILGIPVATIVGFHGSGLVKGDEVYVHFLDGNPKHARIVAMGDENYATRGLKRIEHKDQGALAPDWLSGRK